MLPTATTGTLARKGQRRVVVWIGIRHRGAHLGAPVVQFAAQVFGFGSKARRKIVLFAGIEREIASALLAEAQQTCPYTKATRGNIDVAIKLMPISKAGERT